MTLQAVRHDLEQLRAYIEAGQTERALATIDHALQALEPDRLLTTTEAARALNIRSLNTLKGIVRTERVRTVRRGNRTMIPLDEIERLQTSERVRRVRLLDRLHDEIDGLGGTEGLSDEELADLAAETPGRLPWAEAPRP